MRNVLLGISLLYAAPSYGQPDFAQYPVSENEMFEGSPVPVDVLSYKGADQYRTQLEQGAPKGPNFAGHYTIVSLVCGAKCQDNWVIDAQTGKIVDRFRSQLSIRYQVDSNLLIINPTDPEVKIKYEQDPSNTFYRNLKTSYKVWENKKFNTVAEDNWTNAIKILR